MKGRKILEESNPMLRTFKHPDLIKRRSVLRETLDVLSKPASLDNYHLLASQNLHRWHSTKKEQDVKNKIQVIPGDWGEVTHMLTKTYGTCFAVLNMANAYVPGGGYVEGMAAQEENMFRRTDCHFHISSLEYDAAKNSYTPEMTELITGKNGVVYLDTEKPRVCIRGRENKFRSDLGYAWLKENEIFPFYELRASAQDLRNGEKFNMHDARQRIIAQLETLGTKNIRHVVLGAFGCGAFLNPSDSVARIYKEEILKRIEYFDMIAFAIFSVGYGSKNYASFTEVFKTL